MNDRVARILSWAFQPLVVPLYGFVALWFAPFFYDYAPQVKLKLLGLLSFSVVLIPVLCYWMLRKTNVISTPQADNRKERLGIYLITLMCYFTAGFILLFSHVPFYYVAMLFTMAVCLLLMAVINVYWKISAHAMGMGAMLSMMLFLLKYHQVDCPWIYALWLVLSGFVCSARLQLNAHTPAQLAAGFLLGFVPLWTIILFGAIIF